jgi:methyl-accepting chemotaxis protein
MKKLKIGQRLALSYIILLILTIFANFYSLSNLKETGNLSHELFKKPYVATTETMGVRRDVASIDGDIMGAIFVNNIEKYKGFATDDFNSLNERIEKLHECFTGDEAKLNNLEKSVSELENQYNNIIALVEGGDYKTAKELATNSSSEYCQIYNKCAEDAENINVDAEKVGNEFDKSVSETVSKVWITSSLISLSAIVVGVLVCMYITQSIVEPINKLVVMANKMAKGDFDI